MRPQVVIREERVAICLSSRRLSKAIAENNNIMGIIRGVEVNQSGLASSITHPNSPMQSDLLKTLLKNSRICPMHISIVEAHGTGTEVGDLCKLVSIHLVLYHGRTWDNPLHVTLIKANIGHLEAASGALGLCKLLLMLQHNTIPAQISLKTLHPLIAHLDVDNTVIDSHPVPWVADTTRVAVLNSFGAAGSNGLLVLEEYIKPNCPSSTTSSFVFSISGKSARALENLRSRYMQWLGDTQNINVPFDDIVYATTAHRQLYSFRLAVTAKDKDQLIWALDTVPVTPVEPHGGQVIFIFSGQSSPYLNIGDSLYATSHVFRSCIDRCQHCLISLGYPRILPIISSDTSGCISGSDEEFEVYQCAILAVEFALASLWKHWGVVPAAVIGQSLGEYAAMVTAGVLSIETALSIVAKRAHLMSQRCAIGKAGMASINLPSAQVELTLTADMSFLNVTVACVNTESCVVSGPIEELQQLATHLMSVFGCKADNLRDHVAALLVHPPSIPIASNVYGTVIPVGDSLTFQANYFARHCRQAVFFGHGLRELEQYLDPSQIEAWIDVGPHAICLPMIKSTLSPS
ncbi:acyl transferase/acyl hydrolase/lysophospholipase [Boletus reticuloceps]|uniref:Acyl transferase/acyl hydrolase/lysophospholipase n=1 Tax=Boletus reticuloceps TaxID=495285 RepID=A0A8I3A521_9AGAM|nr:acyl transferase/acyl hydrolase/lysophospholipase [Boletus reticuloceps]